MKFTYSVTIEGLEFERTVDVPDEELVAVKDREENVGCSDKTIRDERVEHVLGAIADDFDSITSLDTRTGDIASALKKAGL